MKTTTKTVYEIVTEQISDADYWGCSHVGCNDCGTDDQVEDYSLSDIAPTSGFPDPDTVYASYSGCHLPENCFHCGKPFSLALAFEHRACEKTKMAGAV